MTRRICTATFLVLLIATAATQAHYPWIVVKPKPGENGAVDFYFEGGASAGDGQYLDPFIKRGKTWIRTADSAKPKQFKLKEAKSPGKRWLTAPLPGGKPLAIENDCLWGVYRYGKTDVLLHYYSRNVTASSAEEVNALSDAPHLQLNLSPKLVDGAMELTVTWKGKPAEKVSVNGSGPGGIKVKALTDAQGKVRVPYKGKGRFQLKTLFDESDKSGEYEKKAYAKIRHQCTLLVTVP